MRSDKVVSSEESHFVVTLRAELGLTIEQALRARKLSEEISIDGFKEFVESSPEVLANVADWSGEKEK